MDKNLFVSSYFQILYSVIISYQVISSYSSYYIKKFQVIFKILRYTSRRLICRPYYQQN